MPGPYRFLLTALYSKKKKIWNKVDCQHSERKKKSQTHKRSTTTKNTELLMLSGQHVQCMGVHVWKTQHTITSKSKDMQTAKVCNSRSSMWPINGAAISQASFLNSKIPLKTKVCCSEHTQSFWARFEMCLKENSFNYTRFSVNPTLILFGHDGKTTANEGFDFILLHAKFFVYKFRLNKLKPTLEAFIDNWNTYMKLISMYI